MSSPSWRPMAFGLDDDGLLLVGGHTHGQSPACTWGSWASEVGVLLAEGAADGAIVAEALGEPGGVAGADGVVLVERARWSRTARQYCSPIRSSPSVARPDSTEGTWMLDSTRLR